MASHFTRLFSIPNLGPTLFWNPESQALIKGKSRILKKTTASLFLWLTTTRFQWISIVVISSKCSCLVDCWMLVGDGLGEAINLTNSKAFFTRSRLRCITEGFSVWYIRHLAWRLGLDYILQSYSSERPFTLSEILLSIITGLFLENAPRSHLSVWL